MASNVVQLRPRAAAATATPAKPSGNAVKFTDALVREWLKAAAKATGRKEYADTENPNLRARVSAGRVAYSVMVYDKAKAQRVRVSLGDHRALNVARARLAAARATLGVKDGTVITGEALREQSQAADLLQTPVAQLFDAYLERRVIDGRKLAPASVETYRRELPLLLGTRFYEPIARITPSVLAECVEARIARASAVRVNGTAYTAGSRGGAQVAVAVLCAMCRMFGLPVPDGVLKRAKVLGANLEPKRARLGKAQVPAFAQWLVHARTGAQPYERTAYEMILTGLYMGLRIATIQALAVEWIDWKAGTVTIPADVLKNKRDAMLPVPGPLLAIWKERAARRRAGLLFPSVTDEAKPASVSRALEGLPIKLSPHDLRKAFATAIDDAGASPVAAKLLMTHTPKDIMERHYILTHAWPDLLDKMRPVSDAIGAKFSKPVSRAAILEMDKLARTAQAESLKNRRELHAAKMRRKTETAKRPRLATA